MPSRNRTSEVLMLSNLGAFPWRRILVWALVLGVIVSLFADWGAWDRLPLNTLWRVLIVAAGGLAGWLLNVLFGFYVGMGINVIESMGIFRFSSDTPKKIENGFIFVSAVVGAIIAALVIR
jgi:hypothetical protein